MVEIFVHVLTQRCYHRDTTCSKDVSVDFGGSEIIIRG